MLTNTRSFLFCLVSLVFIAPVAQSQHVSNLDGYSTLTVSADFETYLRDNPHIGRMLMDSSELSEAVLADKKLQQQIIDGDVRLNDLRRDLAQKQRENEMTATGSHQRVGGLAAHARAQRDIGRGATVFDSDSSAHMQQNIKDAIDQLEQEGVDANSVAAMEYRQKIVGLINELVEKHPEKMAAFFEDTELLQRVLSKGLTLEQALAEVDVEVEVVASPTAPVDPEESMNGADRGLQQVSGNKYKLDGATTWDLNYVPEPHEAELDENGWPKYLNVPSDCPAADSDIVYSHYGTRTNHGSKSLQNQSVRENFWAASGNTFVIPLTDKEIVATPFVTVNAGFNHSTLATNLSGAHMGGGHQELVISHCPGVFDGFTPGEKRPVKPNAKAGEPLVKNFRMLTQDIFVHNPEDSSDIKYGYTLDPNTRYFVNIRNKRLEVERSDGTKHIESHCGQVYGQGSWSQKQGHGVYRTIKGQRLPVCAGTLFVHYGDPTRSRRTQRQMMSGGSQPPYVGPCLDNSRPRPINYHADGGEKVNFKYTRDATRGCGRTDVIPMDYSCYDPANKLPPIIFRAEHTLGSPNRLVEGVNNQAMSNYLCGPTVCAAHSDGEVKVHHSPHRLYKRHGGYERLEQCQYDEARGRYDWYLVSSRNLKHRPSTHGYLSDPTYEARPDVCMWDGKEYPLGTVMTQNYSNGGSPIIQLFRQGEHKYVCQQRAPKPALPRFAHVENGLSPHPESVPRPHYATYEVSFDLP